jgi:hypothetical protein
MSKINVEWYQGHKMPENPSEEQRAQWHHGHGLYCG